MAAADAGDDVTLLSLFAKDATLTSDGGGVVAAARKVVHGRSRIARLYYFWLKTGHSTPGADLDDQRRTRSRHVSGWRPSCSYSRLRLTATRSRLSTLCSILKNFTDSRLN